MKESIYAGAIAYGKAVEAIIKKYKLPEKEAYQIAHDAFMESLEISRKENGI